MSVGFKLSAELLEHLSRLSGPTVADTAAATLDTVQEMAGDHVRHNVYFIDFPANVPDTVHFWMPCIAGAGSARARRSPRERTAARCDPGAGDADRGQRDTAGGRFGPAAGQRRRRAPVGLRALRW
jgi:hypothetical protein